MAALNYCPNCGADLQDMQTNQDMPDDVAPDLPPENADPPVDETLSEAQAMIDHVESNPDSPLAGQTSAIRGMVQELEDAIAKGESLDLPYYRQMVFQLKQTMDRIGPVAMVARWRYGTTDN